LSGLTNHDGGALFDDLGTPSDANGDSAAETVSNLGGFSCPADSFKNPESTPQLPQWVSDLGNPHGVGALLDKTTLIPSSIL